MKVIVGNGGPVSSDDRPIMIKLTPDEINHIRNMPDGDDIFVAHPPHWPEPHAKRWAEANQSHMIGKPLPPESFFIDSDDNSHAVVHSDEEINSILAAPDEDSPKEEPAALVAEPVKPTENTTPSDQDVLDLLGISTDSIGSSTPKTEIEVGATFRNEKDV